MTHERAVLLSVRLKKIVVVSEDVVGRMRRGLIPAAHSGVEVDGSSDIIRGCDVHGAGSCGIGEVCERAVTFVVGRRRSRAYVSVTWQHTRVSRMLACQVW